MSINVLTKAKAGLQDLLVGIATVAQTRNGTSHNIDSVPLTKTLSNRTELKSLDVATTDLYFENALILGLVIKGDNLGGLFHHEPTVAQSTANDIDIIVDSTTGPNGVWKRVVSAPTAGIVSTDKSWPFGSPSATNGIFFFGGLYHFETTDNDFNPAVNFGSVNSSHAAHMMFVTAAGASGGTDTVIRVSGTSITDAAVRTPADFEDITISDTVTVNTMFETSKKWLGQIAITKLSGPDLLCNYGFAKYWDNNNTDFTIKGLEALWWAGASDAGANIQLIHHKSAGWTYVNAGEPTFVELAGLQTDHVTEYQTINNDGGAWKRTNLNQAVLGSAGEGFLFCVTTTINKTFELGSLMVSIDS